ncbi:MAG: hypothetical protein COV35_00755 [Alphaproteobacteria bacterium CG11_big_fil_rev_8_21_14_0_20_39_49]|nr:MAG: hypothetical protein COV35_00755 [Alphaproteobacteria bacterium CG11_big_fil_rev_8_21_14_0_20_39_49]
MLLGHIALGIYTLSLTIGIYILHNLAGKTAWFQKIITWVLVAIEIAGIVCVLYYLGNIYQTEGAAAPTHIPTIEKGLLP